MDELSGLAADVHFLLLAGVPPVVVLGRELGEVAFWCG